MNENDATILETLLFESNGLDDNKNALTIESIIECITTKERFIAPLVWFHLSRSPLFLKPLNDSESPYFTFSSRLVVQNVFRYIFILFFMPCWTFIIKVTLYVICFFVIFFISLLCILYSQKKMSQFVTLQWLILFCFVLFCFWKQICFYFFEVLFSFFVLFLCCNMQYDIWIL